MEVEEELRLEQEKWLVEEQKPRAREMYENEERINVDEEARLKAKEAKQRAEEEGRLKIEQKKNIVIKLAEQAENEKATERRMEVEEEIVLEQGKRHVEEKIHSAQKEQLSMRAKAEEQRCDFEEQHRIDAAEEERQKRVVKQKQFLIDVPSKLAKEDIEKAIEKVLAMKDERAQLLGIDVDAALTIDDKGPSPNSASVALVDTYDDISSEDVNSVIKNKESRNKRYKKKKKKNQSSKFEKTRACVETHNDSVDDIDVEYIQVINVSDPLYLQYMKIVQLTDGEKEKEETPVDVGKYQIKEKNINPMALRKKPVDLDDHEKDDRIEEEKPKLSIKKLKKLSRTEVAELKQNVSQPEVVEMHDLTAKDPVIILHLKASRNTVRAPCHWCAKRKYLPGKHKFKKPAFELPDFNKRTGFTEMQQALQEKETKKTRRTKVRERVRPKLCESDIDYQKICDDIFKWNYNCKYEMIYVTPLEKSSADSY